jgi:alcohol dehydrogenase class IV
MYTLGCRVFQAVFNMGARVLPWRKAQAISGEGSIGRIPGLLQEGGAKKPLVVSGPNLFKRGLTGLLLSALDGAGLEYALWTDVEANPSIATVEKIAARYMQEGCDSFIALGGGSPMDAAKAAAAKTRYPKRKVKDFGGLLKVRRRLPLFIAVPSTAGSGSETTIAAIITDTATHHKYAIMDLNLIPRYAVLDPCLTRELPPGTTAATGMDALTHAVEAYLCWTYNTAESIRYALDAVKLIFENLERAYTDGNDMEARNALLLASYKAGFAFTRAGVGNVHAIAHTLGGLYNTPHGLANAVILPLVLADYGKAAALKLAHLAKLCGVGSTAEDFIEAIRAMNRRMGIPAGFDFIQEADIPQMIRWAMKEANPLYPVPVVYGKERFRRVIENIRLPS